VVKYISLVHTRSGGRYTRNGFKKGWQLAIKAWCEAGNERFTFHDLRAKALTDVIEQGRKASELTAHKSEIMPVRVYNRRKVRKSSAVK